VGLVVKKGWKILTTMWAGMPVLLSATGAIQYQAHTILNEMNESEKQH
jgi:hypothetical protein